MARLETLQLDANGNAIYVTLDAQAGVRARRTDYALWVTKVGTVTVKGVDLPLLRVVED